MTNIIKGSFGGKPKAPEPGPYAKKPEPAPSQEGPVLKDADGNVIPLTPDQHKALGLVLSGKSFILIAITPTSDGADFHTAVHGDHTDLRNAHGELPGVIDRAFGRAGVI